MGEIVRGGLLAQENMTVRIEAEATHLPTEIEVDIEGLEIGSHVTAATSTLPSGSGWPASPSRCCC